MPSDNVDYAQYALNKITNQQLQIPPIYSVAWLSSNKNQKIVQQLNTRLQTRDSISSRLNEFKIK